MQYLVIIVFVPQPVIKFLNFITQAVQPGFRNYEAYVQVPFSKRPLHYRRRDSKQTRHIYLDMYIMPVISHSISRMHISSEADVRGSPSRVYKYEYVDSAKL